jgi:hypothetical protein
MYDLVTTLTGLDMADFTHCGVLLWKESDFWMGQRRCEDKTARRGDFEFVCVGVCVCIVRFVCALFALGVSLCCGWPMPSLCTSRYTAEIEISKLGTPSKSKLPPEKILPQQKQNASPPLGPRLLHNT